MHVVDENELKVEEGGKTALHLRLYDVNHAGVQAFLRCIHAHPRLLQESLDVVNALLYDDAEREGKRKRRNVPRSITFTIRSMDGVAYTTGNVLDDDHKEIHFSAGYIEGVANREEKAPEELVADLLKPTPTTSAAPSKPTSVPAHQRDAGANLQAEVRGVLVHEIVHAVQFTGKGSCPGGLIEGMADWVRLKAGLAAPHWHPHRDGKEKKEKEKKGEHVRWDAGYATTAFFLQWLEERLGVRALIPRLNQVLASRKWEDGEAMSRAAEQEVDMEALWKEYCSRKE